MDYKVSTTADQDATLAAALRRENAMRTGQKAPTLAPEAFFAQLVADKLTELAALVLSLRAQDVARKFSALDEASRSRIEAALK